MLHWSRKQISILLSIIALILWSYSITQVKFNIGLYGLIHSLPVTFFIALGILTIASAILWTSPRNKWKLLLLQLCLLIISLWLAPLITGGSAAFSGGQYWYTGFSEYIVREGNFNQQLFLFHNWPGAIILLAILSDILGLLTPYALVIEPSLVSFAIQFVFLLFIYLFLKNMLGEGHKNYYFAGLWIFELGNWLGLSYFGSQPAGYLLFLLTLILFIGKSSLSQNFKSLGSRVSSILTLACVIVTHLLSSFFILATAAMLQITKRINARTLITFGVVLLMVWLLYEATAFFECSLHKFIELGFRLDIIIQKGVLERIAGSESRQAVSLARTLTSILFLAIGFSGFIFGRKTKKHVYVDNTAFAIAFGLIFVGIAVSFGYGKELFERVYFFLLPVIAYFGMKFADQKFMNIALCLLLCIVLPLHFISHYGGQIMEYLPSSSLAASHFFLKHTKGGNIIEGGTILIFEHMEYYHRTIFDRLREDESLLYKPRPGTFSPQYVSISSGEKNRMYYLYDNTQFVQNIQNSLEHSTGYNVFYVNSDVNLYIRE